MDFIGNPKPVSHREINFPFPQQKSLPGKTGRLSLVHPWGVEPQSKEPESFILSIELRVPLNEIEGVVALKNDSPLYLRGKSKKYL